MWIGLSLDSDQRDMMQSLIEGIALRTAEAIRAMASILPISDEISIDGGISANPYFCQFLADTLDRCLLVQSFPELTAVGTAQLAGAEIMLVEDSEIKAQIYEPTVSCSDRTERFAQAVSRSRHWRD